MKNQKCWCGSDSFYIRFNEGHKNRPLIVCQSCKAERVVITPGVSVEIYSIEPDFDKESE